MHHRVAPGKAVEGLTDAVQVAVAPTVGCATTHQRDVRCWALLEGIPSRGSGSLMLRRRAERVKGIDNAAGVALGRQRGCALLVNGEVACWDTNDGREAGRVERIGGVRDARTLTMMPSSDVACAVTARRTLACWGPATRSLSGFSSDWDLDSAREHPTLADVRGVALSQMHYCVLQSHGRVSCFGFGEAPLSLQGVHQVVATDGATCAITANRGVACWGNPALTGAGPQVATGPFIGVPREVAGLTNVAALSAGTESICALLYGGTARCWGQNATGGLGDGTLERRFVPVPVCNARGIVQLAAGPQSCAVFGGGSLRCWGDLDEVEYD
jgi:hypothetical protein